MSTIKWHNVTHMRFLIRSSRQFARGRALTTTHPRSFMVDKHSVRTSAIPPPSLVLSTRIDNRSRQPFPIICFTLPIAALNVSNASAEDRGKDDEGEENLCCCYHDDERPRGRDVRSIPLLDKFKSFLQSDFVTKIDNLQSFFVNAFRALADYQIPTLTAGIVSTNLAITSAFYVACAIERWGSNNKPIGFIMRNFVVSDKLVRQGRYHVLLTSMFTHLDLVHLLKNSFGTAAWVCLSSEDLSYTKVGLLFFFGGLLSSITTVALSRFSVANKAIQSVGGSGGLAALGFYSMISLCHESIEEDDRGTLFIMLSVLASSIFREVRGSMRMWKGIAKDNINYIGHVTGAATGSAAYFILGTDTDARGEVDGFSK